MINLPWAERVPMLSINPDAASRNDVARLATELMEVRLALITAKGTIYALHGDTAWDIYNAHSPEMKQINAALEG